MQNHISSITNFDNVFKFLSILITALTTYFVTKYSTNRPRKLEIKQRQLTHVYLPIHKLIKFQASHNMDKETALLCGTKIKEILSDNYELAFPQLHDLNDSFLTAIKLDYDYQAIFNKISYQVNLDYILLKKALGYPSESNLGIFKRMKRKDKLKSILGWIIIIYIFSTFPVLVLFENYIIKLGMLRYVSLYSISFFLLLYINSLINKIKD
ncbi:hypothetical protein [Clostridium sp.]|uniref:hypothetical protein n=1 Tax=Clostridium sp. TaxID=1506 RepID=UPI003217816C